MEFLNKEGVQILWSKVKDKVSSVNKQSIGLNNVTNDAQVKRSEMGAANGVPTLDANGKIPVDQLGNLDTVVSMVVTELPTTDIKTNKIYLVKDSTTEGDLYQEYLYVDNKWEKVGTHKQEVDLTSYAKKSEAIKSLDISQDQETNILKLTAVDGTLISNESLMPATSSVAGLMTANDKAKLDGIATDANKYTLPIASATALGGIKLGSGLSATSDGTVSVSANVAILGTGDADGSDINDGRILFSTEDNTDDYAIIGNDGESYSISIAEKNVNRSNTTYISASNVQISSANEQNDRDINSVNISVNGITLTDKGTVTSNSVFMTDGTTQKLTAITTDELNEILV